jgi:hypothetical protein
MASPVSSASAAGRQPASLATAMPASNSKEVKQSASIARDDQHRRQSSQSINPKSPSPSPAAVPAAYYRHDSVANRGLLDESAPSSPSPRNSYTAAKIFRDSYHSQSSDEFCSRPVSMPMPAHVHDPEKAAASVPHSHASRSYYGQQDDRAGEWAGEDPEELKSKTLRLLVGFLFRNTSGEKKASPANMILSYISRGQAYSYPS